VTCTLEVSLVTLGDPATMTGGYLYHRRMAVAARRHSASVRFVSFPHAPWPLSSAAGLGVVRDAAQADVCLLDSICAALAAPWLNALPRSVPLAAILHQPPGGIDHGPLRSALQRRLDLAAYRRCAALVLASSALQTSLPGSLRRARVVVVPPGRDPAGAHAPAGGLRAGREASLLCVGNWIERKGILSLIEAFAELPVQTATLHLVGDPWAAPRYGARVWLALERLDVMERVVVHGPEPATRLQELYAGSDVFVLPSLLEPYGTVYGEALAHGLPVVGWRAGNLVHLATDGVEGLLVEPGDIAALSDALLCLCRDVRARQGMAEAARRRAETLPTWEQSARNLFGVLRAVAGRGR
jgi:glycosyltransferase involved in cell wall biosynthesis